VNLYEQALIETSLEAYRNDFEFPNLDGVDSKTAFLLGFQTAIKHQEDIVRGDTFEYGVITFVPQEEQ